MCRRAGGAPYGFQGAVFPGISSSSLKQLWVGHVFFRLGISGLQELVEAEELAAEGAGVGGPFRFAGIDGERGTGSFPLAGRGPTKYCLTCRRGRPVLSVWKNRIPFSWERTGADKLQIWKIPGIALRIERHKTIGLRQGM